MFDDVRDLYQDIILRHSRNPLHARRLDPYDAASSGDNPMCGDRCEVRLRFGDHDTLAEIGFEARGCAISMASADLMAETIAGRSKPAARALAAEFTTLVRTGQSASQDPAIETLRPLSGVSEYPSRVKCATLPWAALVAALDGAQEATSE
jgi:nitrogen fixation NifU-like protein